MKPTDSQAAGSALPGIRDDHEAPSVDVRLPWSAPTLRKSNVTTATLGAGAATEMGATGS